jgi:protein MpaA
MTVPIRRLRTTLLMVLILLAAGCSRGTGGEGGLRIDGRTSPSRTAFAYREIILGRTVAERAISCRLLGDGPEVILIMATIHGSEPAGTPLVEALHVYLRDNPARVSGRTIMLIPVANPDGISSRTRTNARGVDLNRNFPAGNFLSRRRNGSQPLSEPESQALHDLILARRPQRIVSIHQPLSCVDYDGPAEDLARAMAAAGGLPVRKLGGQPGSLGSWAGETLGVPIITIELPGGASRITQDELWRRYGEMLLIAIDGAGIQ